MGNQPVGFKAIMDLVRDVPPASISGTRPLDKAVEQRIHYRDDEERNLRVPVEAAGETVCSKGSDCEGLQVDRTNGVVLKSFHDDGGLCVMCMRYQACLAAVSMMLERKSDPSKQFRICSWCNLPNSENGYRKADCLYGLPGQFIGLWGPIVHHQRHMYERCRLRNIKLRDGTDVPGDGIEGYRQLYPSGTCKDFRRSHHVPVKDSVRAMVAGRPVPPSVAVRRPF